MGKVRLRFLSFRIETFGLVHKHLTHCYVTVAELRMWITRVLRPQPRAAGVLAVLLLFIGFIHPVVADAVTINALLELDLRDWSSIYSVKVIDQCTSALRDHTNLSEDQVCRLHILKAVAHDLNGEPKVAIRELTEALRIHPNDCQALRIRGETYSTLRQHERAHADFESLLRLQPKSGLAHAHVAICLIESGQKNEGLKLAEKAIALDSDEALGYLARAEASLRLKNAQGAFRDFSQCIALSLGDGKLMSARPFLLRASILLNFYDNTKKALPDLLMARRLDPQDPVITGMFCEYYFKSGKYNIAFYLIEQLPIREKSRPDLQGRKVECLLQRNRKNEALGIAESMILQDPKWWFCYVSRGQVFFSQEKYKEALADYDKSLSISTDNFAGMAGKAYLLATCPEVRFRDGLTARKLATSCCERTDYSVPRHLMLLSMACAECGDYKEAIRWAKKALEKAEPGFPFLEDYRRRLALFEKGKPFRFSPKLPVLDYICP